MDMPDVDLEIARKTVTSEGEAVAALGGRIDEAFADAARAVYRCGEVDRRDRPVGKVVLTGIGKAGLVAQKISATLASTGTQSIFLHPVEALHGDLGRLRRGDVVIALSHSGSTEEIIRLIDHVKARGAQLIALTGTAEAPLAKHADITITYGRVEEACPLGLAPTVSTTCMLALGDALAMTVMRMRRFKPEQFAAFHPAGALGRKLLVVEEAMTSKDKQFSLARDDMTLGEALAEAEAIDRRSGAVILVDSHGKLSGIFTDADLRRVLVKQGSRDVMSRPMQELMTRGPLHIHLGELASKALAILNEYRIDELPVLDENDRPVGIIDVQDLIGLKTVSNG
ncbi:MAG: KpsF/GutQ family sugar-phosphate isomerase [Planctomycetes bacterium]|nr:KpsF/GutQ family sugar-phosphate isomerase [Planctomycetota bacterium]